MHYIKLIMREKSVSHQIPIHLPSAHIEIPLYSLSRKWKELVDKARAKQLQPHEYNTGTAITYLYFIGFLLYINEWIFQFKIESLKIVGRH